MQPLAFYTTAATATNITTNNTNTQSAKCTSQKNHVTFNFNHSTLNCVYVLPNSVNIYRRTNLTELF